MRGALLILAILAAWQSLYQGIVWLGDPPVRDAELVPLGGIVRHVDRPLMRNRLVEQIMLEVEAAPARFERIPVRTSSLTYDVAQTLIGKRIDTLVALKRPRNRWLYDLKVGADHRVQLDHQRAVDAARRAAHLPWMLAMALLSALLFYVALRPASPAPTN